MELREKIKDLGFFNLPNKLKEILYEILDGAGKGEKGEVGPQGPKGDKGDDGAQGPKGDKGDDGWGTEVEYNALVARIEALESPEQ